MNPMVPNPLIKVQNDCLWRFVGGVGWGGAGSRSGERACRLARPVGRNLSLGSSQSAKPLCGGKSGQTKVALFETHHASFGRGLIPCLRRGKLFGCPARFTDTGGVQTRGACPESYRRAQTTARHLMGRPLLWASRQASDHGRRIFAGVP